MLPAISEGDAAHYLASLPTLTEAQAARLMATHEAHERLRPIWRESERRRLMNSNPEEVAREIQLIEASGGYGCPAAAMHLECLGALNDARAAKYGEANVQRVTV